MIDQTSNLVSEEGKLYRAHRRLGM